MKIIETQAYPDQKPGTSGLRKKVKQFRQPHYLENFIQSIFNTISPCADKTLIIGGDGRYFNKEAIQIIIKMAVANDFRKLIIGRGGILSTPAASCLIRKFSTDGGIILSASHNPGGPDEDFGVKFNGASGAPASESLTSEIAKYSREIHQYKIARIEDIDLDTVTSYELNNTRIEIISSVSDYSELMTSLFDFELIKKAFKSGTLKMCFDAMHAVTGGYAKTILEQQLCAPAGTVINATPLTDFGGGHRWLARLHLG